MKGLLYALTITFVFSFAAFGQKLGKPTLTAVDLSASQQKTLREGVALHDAKKYAEAIEKYRSIIADCPDCVGAMYELAFSLMESGKKLEAIEIAYKGTQYVSDELPLFYGMIANSLDDYGKPEEAIQIYLDGIKALEGSPRFSSYRSRLYFNLGVTYLRQKKYDQSKKVLKSAVENDPRYPSPHFLLAYIFKGTRYRIPAILSAARFISLELNTDRSKTAAAIINELSTNSSQKGPDGKITINIDILSSKEEGDFGAAELLFAISGPEIGDKEESKQKTTPEEQFSDRIDMLIAFLDPKDKANKNTFVGKNYFPFVTEMKQRGFVKVFAFTVLSINGNSEATKWLADNQTKFDEFVTWAKAYQPPAK